MPSLPNHRRQSSILLLGCLLYSCNFLYLSGVAARHTGSISGVVVVNGVSRHRQLPTGKLVFGISNLRGGSTATTTTADEENNDEANDTANVSDDITQHPEFKSLQSYRMKQQILMQLRSTFLSEALAKRGLPFPTLQEVATPEGATPPQPVDWDCALATEENPKSCLFSFDAQPNTKVVAPLGSTDWIGLSTLNRLRRTDPTKVEPMWHTKYAILDSWFHPESEYSLLQHVGVRGFLLNALLQGYRLQLALGLSLILGTILFMPVLEYMANRILVSGLLWINWHQWYRFVHAALPLKLFLGQMILKFFATLFDNLVGIVKDQLVELENDILEQSIPLTVGVPDKVLPSQQLEQDLEDDDAEWMLDEEVVEEEDEEEDDIMEFDLDEEDSDD